MIINDLDVVRLVTGFNQVKDQPPLIVDADWPLPVAAVSPRIEGTRAALITAIKALDDDVPAEHRRASGVLAGRLADLLGPAVVAQPLGERVFVNFTGGECGKYRIQFFVAGQQQIAVQLEE